MGVCVCPLPLVVKTLKSPARCLAYAPKKAARHLSGFARGPQGPWGGRGDSDLVLLVPHTNERTIEGQRDNVFEAVRRRVLRGNPLLFIPEGGAVLNGGFGAWISWIFCTRLGPAPSASQCMGSRRFWWAALEARENSPVCVCVCVCVCVSTDRKTSRTALLFLRSFLSTAFLALFLSRGSQRVCVCVCVCLSVFLSFCLSVFLSFCLSVFLSAFASYFLYA